MGGGGDKQFWKNHSPVYLTNFEVEHFFRLIYLAIAGLENERQKNILFNPQSFDRPFFFIGAAQIDFYWWIME